MCLFAALQLSETFSIEPSLPTDARRCSMFHLGGDIVIGDFDDDGNDDDLAVGASFYHVPTYTGSDVLGGLPIADRVLIWQDFDPNNLGNPTWVLYPDTNSGADFSVNWYVGFGRKIKTAVINRDGTDYKVMAIAAPYEDTYYRELFMWLLQQALVLL